VISLKLVDPAFYHLTHRAGRARRPHITYFRRRSRRAQRVLRQLFPDAVSRTRTPRRSGSTGQ
jgi:hypothetical protein